LESWNAWRTISEHDILRFMDRHRIIKIASEELSKHSMDTFVVLPANLDSQGLVF
jgi:hypothetical protein